MAWRALSIAITVGEGPYTIDQQLVNGMVMRDENQLELVNALPAALVGAHPRVVEILQEALNYCHFGYVNLRNKIDELAHNIEPGNMQHTKRGRFT